MADEKQRFLRRVVSHRGPAVGERRCAKSAPWQFECSNIVQVALPDEREGRGGSRRTGPRQGSEADKTQHSELREWPVHKSPAPHVSTLVGHRGALQSKPARRMPIAILLILNPLLTHR